MFDGIPRTQEQILATSGALQGEAEKEGKSQEKCLGQSHFRILNGWAFL